jgi:hypothetical protein
MNPLKKRALLPLAVLSLVLLLGVIGCSKSGTVTGKVIYDHPEKGKVTIPMGTITFHPETGTSVTVEIVDGEFSAKKIPPGSVAVTVSTATQRAAYKAAEKQAKSGGMPEGGGTGAPKIQDKMRDMGEMKDMERAKEEQAKRWEQLKNMIDVPEKYWDKETSGLKFEIKAGSQDLEIELQKVEPPKKK